MLVSILNELNDYNAIIINNMHIVKQLVEFDFLDGNINTCLRALRELQEKNYYNFRIFINDFSISTGNYSNAIVVDELLNYMYFNFDECYEDITNLIDE